MPLLGKIIGTAKRQARGAGGAGRSPGPRRGAAPRHGGRSGGGSAMMRAKGALRGFMRGR